MEEELIREGIDLRSAMDQFGNPVDAKILPLLIVLNHIGIGTTSSCEGHSLSSYREGLEGIRIVEEKEHSFVAVLEGYVTEFDEAPWVDIKADSAKKRWLREELKEFPGEVRWVLKGDHLQALPRYSLAMMHRSIYELADHLSRL